MSKECILSNLKKDRAQRFHPSLFCSLIFDIRRFAVKSNLKGIIINNEHD